MSGHAELCRGVAELAEVFRQRNAGASIMVLAASDTAGEGIAYACDSSEAHLVAAAFAMLDLAIKLATDPTQPCTVAATAAHEVMCQHMRGGPPAFVPHGKLN